MDNREATVADRVTCLGFKFRSKGHLTTFRLSLFLMISVIVMRLSGIGSTEQFVANSIIAAHTWSTLCAIAATKGGRFNGITYSRDCIWFNALMAAVDACIFYVGAR